MKLVFCTLLLFLSLTSFAQEQPKAIVEVNKMNVVYRGVSNPLTLSMPGTVSFEASAPGLKKVDDYGNYIMVPGSGLTVDIELRGKLSNGETVSAIKTFRIKDLPAPIGTINKLGCGKKCIIELTKDEFLNGKVGIKIENFIHEYEAEIQSFKLKLNDSESFFVQGNGINGVIENLRVGDSILIYYLKAKYGPPFSYFKMRQPSNIRIKIIQD